MKMGICVTGQMRAIESWETFKPFLVKEGRQSEIFLHTWHQTETTRVPRLFDPLMGGSWNPLVSSNQEAIEKLSPTNYMFEENITQVVDQCPETPPYPPTRHRVLSMWRSQYKSCALANKKLNSFDIMCRTRSDLVFETDPFEIFEGNPPPKNVVFVPEGSNGGIPECSPDVGLHDWFGVAEPNTFVKFVSLYENICEYLKNTDFNFFPEVMLKYHVDKMGLTIVRYPLKYSIARV
jgi:hypothetical protein